MISLDIVVDEGTISVGISAIPCYGACVDSKYIYPLHGIACDMILLATYMSYSCPVLHLCRYSATGQRML